MANREQVEAIYDPQLTFIEGGAVIARTCKSCEPAQNSAAEIRKILFS